MVDAVQTEYARYRLEAGSNVGEADDVSGRLVLKGVDGDVWW